jgi:hypothetical protein
MHLCCFSLQLSLRHLKPSISIILLFPSLIFPSGQDLAVVAVKREKSENLLKNPASVIDQFANAQTRHVDLVLLTKTTVTTVFSLSLTGFIAFAPGSPLL